MWEAKTPKAHLIVDRDPSGLLRLCTDLCSSTCLARVRAQAAYIAGPAANARQATAGRQRQTKKAMDSYACSKTDRDRTLWHSMVAHY
jgi:hypothetical protein